MKLIQYALSEIHAQGIYSGIALVIFFLVFIAIVWHTLRLRKEDVNQMSHMPLEEDSALKSLPGRADAVQE